MSQANRSSERLAFLLSSPETSMRPYPSPLEHLAAFAITFFSGVLSVLGLAAYLGRQRKKRDFYAS